MAREIIDYRREPVNVALLINHIVKLTSKYLSSISNLDQCGFLLLHVVNTNALLFKELKARGCVCLFELMSFLYQTPNLPRRRGNHRKEAERMR